MVGKTQVIEILQRPKYDEENKCSRKQKLSYIDDIQQRNKHQRINRLNNG